MKPRVVKQEMGVRMDKPLLSIILPVYNEESSIDEALDSLLEQTLEDFEIICVDDGSSDSTRDVIAARVEADSRVRLLEQENSGPGPARNLAMKESRGMFVAFMDGDDYLPDNDVYKTLIETADRFGVDACCGHAILEVDEGLKCTDPLRHFISPQLMRYNDYQYDYGFTKYVFKTDLIRRNNITFPALRRFQDPPFLVRCLYLAQKFAYAAIPSYVHRALYKPTSWPYVKARDYLKGILDLTEFSRDHGLAKLHYTQLIHVEYNWYDTVMSWTRKDDTGEMVSILERINEAFDPNLIGALKPVFSTPYTIRPLREL